MRPNNGAPHSTTCIEAFCSLLIATSISCCSLRPRRRRRLDGSALTGVVSDMDVTRYVIAFRNKVHKGIHRSSVLLIKGHRCRVRCPHSGGLRRFGRTFDDVSIA